MSGDDDLQAIIRSSFQCDRNYLKSLEDRNHTVSQTWQRKPTFADVKEPPTQGMTVFSCADWRGNPSEYLALKNEGTTIRNAGGRVTPDVLTSLELISSSMPLGMVVIIHHTNCGASAISNDHIRASLSERRPDLAHGIRNKHWGSFHDVGLDQSVKDDVALLKTWEFAPPGLVVCGYVCDITTGKIRQVVPPNFPQ